MPTKIPWATETWNPISGCTPVSAGCAHCYAKKMAKRLRGRFGYPADEPFRVTFHPDRLNQPKCWRKPRRIFVCSMGDLWHPFVEERERQSVLCAAAAAPQHTYLFLTKRPERLSDDWWRPDKHENWWVGTSVENQATADERIPHLLRCRAAVRYISYEPALQPISFRWAKWCPIPTNKKTMVTDELDGLRMISWLILGAESIGNRPGRPCKLEWIESAIEQAKTAGVPCFVKQLHLGGKLVKDVSQFPKHLRVQEYPG